VYDLCVPRESGVRAERSGAARGTKRRGRRSGSRNARKCRRLVTADPDSLDPPFSKQRYYRASYREARLISYVSRAAAVIAKLQKLSAKSSVLRSRGFRSRIDPVKVNSIVSKKFCHMVELVSSVTGSPGVLAKARFCAVVHQAGGNPPGFKFPSYTGRNPWRTLDYKEVLDSFADFKRVRYPPDEKPVGLVELATKPISIDVLCWVGAQARQHVEAPPLQRRVETRRHVAKAPCRFCGQAPCRLPGVNTKGIPLCKRAGVVDPPKERRRNPR